MNVETSLTMHDIYFIANVVGFRSQTEAARAMNISRSAVSQKITSVEMKIGLKIFERGPRIFSLNAAGGGILPIVKNVIDSFAAISDVAHPEDIKLAT